MLRFLLICACFTAPTAAKASAASSVHLMIGSWRAMPNDLHLGNPAKLSTREIGRRVEAKNNATIAAALTTDPAADTSIAALNLVTMVEHDNKWYFPCFEDLSQCSEANDWFISPGRLHCYETITEPFKVPSPRDSTRKNVTAVVCQCDHWMGFSNKGHTNCFEARCVFGSSSCDDPSSLSYGLQAMWGLCGIIECCALLPFLCWAIWNMAAVRMIGRNVTSFSLACVSLMLTSLLVDAGFRLWSFTSFSWQKTDNVTAFAANIVPCSLVVASFMAQSITWIDLLEKAKSLKRSARSGKKRQTIIVAVMLSVFLCAAAALGLSSNFTLLIILDFALLLGAAACMGYAYRTSRPIHEAISKEELRKRFGTMRLFFKRQASVIVGIVLPAVVCYVLLNNQSIRRIETAPLLALTYWSFDLLIILISLIHLFYFKGLIYGRRGRKGTTNSDGGSRSASASRGQQQQTQLYTATNCHTIAVLPKDDDDDDENDGDIPGLIPGGEEKSAPISKAGRSRRRTIAFTVQRGLDANKTVAEIVNKQLAQMMIIPFPLFHAFGAIPRSNSAKKSGINTDADAIAKMGSTASISQPHENGWIVVFISHRWWGGNHPDDKERNLKHGIICRGIEALIRRDKLDASRLGVWIDYACIEQDNEEEMQNGIDSLIAYVHCLRACVVCWVDVCWVDVCVF